jgi:hypothetical protein
MELNKYQTPLTDELLQSLPQEVREQLMDYINNVPFIQSLIKADREYAKDRPRDDKGRIIVDLANPHILENMDYFREAGMNYDKHGTYTNLRPNANPNSEYGKWARRERDRCWNGMVRESDGEWVTGLMYFYMNYCPIELTKIRKGTKIGDRVLTFPEVWEGIYWRFHYMDQARNGGLYNEFNGGSNGAELAARGKSKSYSMASILAHNFIFGENGTSYKNTVSTITAYQKEYLTKDGTLNKFMSMIDFNAKNTQFPNKRITNSLQTMTWQAGYINDMGVKNGSLNAIYGVTSKDNVSKLRGKRAAFIGIEECGTFPKLEDMYNTMIPSVKDGDYWFGEIYVQGTAGDKDSDFEGAKKMMYNPKGYSLYAIPDVYDKVKQGKRNFVFFFPSYVNRKGCYNKDGVSDVTKAMIEILLDRYKIKYNSPDQSAITRTIAENPFTPAEAISRSRGNMFPTADLNERLAQIDANPKEYDNVYSGTLDVTKDGSIEFKPTDDIPIREFPHNDNKIAGAIEIFEMPAIDKQTKKPFQNRYILGCDPYDDDESETMSLGSIFVLDLWSDMIVAEYTGRPQFANDFFEIARRMTLFYNGMLNYENNKKGLFGYFQMNNCLHLLTDTLDFLKDKQLIKDMSYGNKAKGTNATLPINQFGRSLLRGWLLKPVTITSKVEDQQIEHTIPNLFKIRNRALIQELINYNVDGNFDRISSMGMLMLLREDRLVLWGGEPNKEQTVEKDYLGNDDYFTRNFDARFKQKQAPIDDHKIIEA